MKRIWLVFILAFVFIPKAAAADKLENFSQTTEAQQSAQISWRLSGLGKLSGDMILAPNGNILLPNDKNIICIDSNGNVLWESKSSSSGALGQPVIGENNSIFTTNGSSVQEIKLNGNSAWNFSVYSGANNAKAALLAGGSDNRLYLPLSNAIYSLDLAGNYMWMLSSWDSSEAFMTKPDTIREILACAANKQALYLVYGEKKVGYRLAVISNQGKFLWTYWLGDISQAYLLPDDDGGIFATVSFNKNSSSNAGKKAGTGSSTLNTGKVYKFLIDNGIYPTWQQTLKTSSKLSAPVQYMGKVLYITGGNKLFALNVADGSIIWEEPILDLVSPPSIDSHTERIYAGSSDGNLFAVDQSGHMVWNRTLDSSINHSPLIGSDGFLYVFTEKGSLYKIKDKI